ARKFQRALAQRAHAIASQAPNEIAQLQNDILAGTWLNLCRSRGGCTHIIWCQKNGRKRHIGIALEFFDYSTPSARLLMKDDGLKTEPLKKTCHGFPILVILTVNDTYLRADD